MSEVEPYPEGYLDELESCRMLAVKLLRKVVVVEEKEIKGKLN